jgi:hypothetical protein
LGVNSSASNPGDGVSEVVLSLSHQKGKKTNKTKQNNTKQKKPQSVPSSNAMQFQQAFQHADVVWLLSHQRKKEKKSLETVL